MTLLGWLIFFQMAQAHEYFPCQGEGVASWKKGTQFILSRETLSSGDTFGDALRLAFTEWLRPAGNTLDVELVDKNLSDSPLIFLNQENEILVADLDDWNLPSLSFLAWTRVEDRGQRGGENWGCLLERADLVLSHRLGEKELAPVVHRGIGHLLGLEISNLPSLTNLIKGPYLLTLDDSSALRFLYPPEERFDLVELRTFGYEANHRGFYPIVYPNIVGPEDSIGGGGIYVSLLNWGQEEVSGYLEVAYERQLDELNGDQAHSPGSYLFELKIGSESSLEFSFHLPTPFSFGDYKEESQVIWGRFLNEKKLPVSEFKKIGVFDPTYQMNGVNQVKNEGFDFKNYFQAADLAISAEVIGLETVEKQGILWTKVTLKVLETFKGESHDLISFFQLGGIKGSREEALIEMPALEEGMEIVAFLNENEGPNVWALGRSSMFEIIKGKNSRVIDGRGMKLMANKSGDQKRDRRFYLGNNKLIGENGGKILGYSDHVEILNYGPSFSNITAIEFLEFLKSESKANLNLVKIKKPESKGPGGHHIGAKEANLIRFLQLAEKKPVEKK